MDTVTRQSAVRRRSTRYEVLVLIALLALWVLVSWVAKSMVVGGVIVIIVGLIVAVLERRLGRR